MSKARDLGNLLDTDGDVVSGSLDNVPTPSKTSIEALGIELPAANLTGSVPSAALGNVDLTAVRQDIAMLALYNAVSDNRAAYNLPYSFIDQFEDDTGVTTQTDVDNVSEYFATVYTAVGPFTADANTVLLVNFETDPITDSSSLGHTITHSGTAARDSSDKKFGTYSGRTNSGYFSIPSHAAFATGTANFTIEFWVKQMASSGDRQFFSGSGAGHSVSIGEASWSSGQPYFHTPQGPTINFSGWTGHTAGTWYHYALTRVGSTVYAHSNGTMTGSSASTGIGSIVATARYIGKYGPGQQTDLYMDELRFSDIARYGAGDFTPNEVTATNATGTLISDTQTSSVATTKMSGVILYKDNAGTATLGTDLVISLSANNGTNWTDITASNQYEVLTPVFSTGIKMVKIKEQTVTSGTAPVIKAVWANQASGSKETQLHGWAMNY